jgi:hypothetical protein
MARYRTTLRSSVSRFGERVGGNDPASLPTTDLYARFDAHDTANHTPASGIWTPSQGSDATTMLAKDSSAVTQAFSYGARQNNLMTIDCPAGIEFRPSSTTVTTAAVATILMAYSVQAGSGAYHLAGAHGTGNFTYERSTDDSLVWSDKTGSKDIRIAKTGVAATGGAFRIVGFVFSDTAAAVIPVANGSYTLTTTAQILAADISAMSLRTATTAYGGAMTISAGNTADLHIGEILVYDSGDVRQAFAALRYLEDRWGLS